MKILHLSDLHIEKSIIKDQRIVLRALFADLAMEVEQSGPFDMVFFTGDLVAKGNYSTEAIELVRQEFLQPLLDATSIERSQFFMVPGNHDVDLKSQSQILFNAQKGLVDNDDISRHLAEITEPGSLRTGLEEFNLLFGEWVCAKSEFANSHYRAYKIKIGPLKVGVAALNSAWRSTGAPQDGDYGKLLVGTKQLDDVLEYLQDVDIRLALQHHPIHWMTPKDTQYLHRQLLLHFDALFHGHNHESDAQFIHGTSKNYFVSNAGCLYQSREYFNGYCICTYGEIDNSWQLRAREYIEARQVFDVSLRFAPNGIATFQKLPPTPGNDAPLLPTDEYIEALQAACDSRLLSTLVSGVAPHSLRTIFVDPPISKVSAKQLSVEKTNGGTNVFLPLKEIIGSKRSTVFVGAKDMGKTTLLHHLCSLSLDVGQTEIAPFASYVDLDAAGETRASLLESLTAFGQGAYRRSEYLALLRAGSIMICFDNVKTLRTRQLDSVIAFCAEFKSCRFYFAIHEDAEYSLSADSIPRLNHEMDVLYLHPFGRKETRQLTQRWYGESVAQASAKVDEIVSLLSRLNIPRSPFLISALLWIRERQTQFSPVNQAEILDALVDGVMEKLTESKDRSGLDSNIKRHFLAALAEQLHRGGSRRITSHALDAFAVSYFEQKGLLSASGPFIGDLKSKRILLEIGTEVTFMFDSIRAFFLSTRMNESQDLLDAALTSDGLLSLGEELDYFTGRHRDRRDVLKRVAQVVATFKAEAHLNVQLSMFDNIASSGGSLPEEMPEDGKSDDLNSAIARHKPSPETREELLESIDEQSRTRGAHEIEEIRLSRIRGVVGRYLEALRIGSAVLRNSELVNDVQLKRVVYKEFVTNWCEIMIAVMISIDSADDENQGLAALKSFLPPENPNLANYMLKMLAPNVIMSIAAEAMGTAKLQLLIEEAIDESTSTVESVLNVFLSVDLGFEKRFVSLRKLLQASKGKRFVAELIFFKLMQLYLIGRNVDRDVVNIKELLGESVSLMMSIESGHERAAIKARLLNSLERVKLLKR